jgi:2-C-methyl-D-erythritol 4-phosphate cytidylyltransferase
MRSKALFIKNLKATNQPVIKHNELPGKPDVSPVPGRGYERNGPLSVAVIVTAAGSSARMGGPVSRSAVKKEYRVLPDYTGEDGRPLTVLGAAVSAFIQTPAVFKISNIIVTVPSGHDNAEEEARAALPAGIQGVSFVRGGETRRVSVFHALRHIKARGERPDLVLIHDGARPWVSASLIKAVIDAARIHGAAIPVVPAIETPKILDSADSTNTRHDGISGFITRHPRRETIVFAQTPQGFRFGPLMEAHEKAAKKGVEFTDDAEVWAFAWPETRIAAVPGETANRKITVPEDLPEDAPQDVPVC